ncbi:PREDICTED: uncharacterized protein LOC106749268 [Dinoponera quadriceps]|uniref:Uncharacterized protein LOC106749268 n=1 Tax=Dinoponera quadriceps TaxID=609295 RepID=A0A6P3Y1G1_DINQU|nr:PREDICTED: uncharacterized protein LOC106749268 [Dinoponera quadriceps]
MDNSNDTQFFSDTIEHVLQPAKAEVSLSLVKKKILKTNDIIRQYEEKKKENDNLKSKLDIVRKDLKNVRHKYQTNLDMTRKLELDNTNVKQENNRLKKKINEDELSTAGDKQYIQQLRCKIKELEEDYSEKSMDYKMQMALLKDEIKNLEHQLASSKKTQGKKKKSAIADNDTTEQSTETKSSSDVAINVSLSDFNLDKKPEMREQNTMTDEFYNLKDDPYPLFCSKCTTHLHSPIEQICQIMMCSNLIEPIHSRPMSPLSPLSNLTPEPSDQITPSKKHSDENVTDQKSERLDSRNVPGKGPERTDRKVSPGKESEHFDGGETASISKVLSPPRLMNSYYNSMDDARNLKSESRNSPATPQDFAESADEHRAKYNTFATEPPGESDLMIQCSSSIRNMEKIVHSLKRKMKKQMRKVRKRLNERHSCHCNATNYVATSNVASLNPELLNICKSVMELCNNKEKARPKNERSARRKYNTKKAKLKRLKSVRNDWKVEHCKPRNITRTKSEDILDSSAVNQSYLSDDDFPVHSTEVKSVAKVEFVAETGSAAVISHSRVEDSSSRDDNVESADLNYHTETTLVKSPVNPSHGIVNTGSGSQSLKWRGNSSLLKKLRNLKKRTRTGVHSNKQLKVELCPNDSSECFQPAKKRRIAHIPKGISSQPDFAGRDPAEHTTAVQPEVFASFPPDAQSSVETEMYRTTSEKSSTPVAVRRFINSSSFQKTKDPAAPLVNGCSMPIVPERSANSCLRLVNSNDTSGNVLLGTRSNDESVASLVNGCSTPIVERSPSANSLSRLVDFNDVSNNSDVATGLVDGTTSVEETDVLLGTRSRDASPDAPCEILKNDERSAEVTNSTSSRSKSHRLPVVILKPRKNTSNVRKDAHDEASYSRSRSVEGHQPQGDASVPVETAEDRATSEERDDQSLVGQPVEEENSTSPSLKSRSVVENDDNAGKSRDEVDNEAGRVQVRVNNERTAPSDLGTFERNTGFTGGDNNDCENDVKQDNDDNNIDNEGIDVKNGDIRIPCDDDDDDDEEGKVEIRTDPPIKHLNKFLVKEGAKKITAKQRMKMFKILTFAGEFVMKQLHRLERSNWEDFVHCDIVEKLRKTCGPRFLAKYIINFLSHYSNDNSMGITMDKSFTPPAPLMSRCEQKIIMLLIDLDQSKPMLIEYVRAGIHYKLFKLTSKLLIIETELLTRMYVALARLQNDREAVRIMCCDALYCMGFRAINVLYTILTSWPEIFPHIDARKGLLPKCIAFLISQQNDNAYQKLIPLKNLISKYYGYTQEVSIDDITNELMTAFTNEQQDGLQTAIILLAKRNGTTWAYKNIIKTPLLPMIIFENYPCMYSAFCLLGKLMRSFPLKSKDNSVKDIAVQLSDLLASNEFSDDVQEGIASALLSLSRHEFSTVTNAIIKWTPKEPLRPTTVAQIEAHIKLRPRKFWNKYVQEKKLFEIQPK